MDVLKHFRRRNMKAVWSGFPATRSTTHFWVSSPCWSSRSWRSGGALGDRR